MSTYSRFTLLAAVAVLSLAPSLARAEGVEWLRSAEQAAELAQRTGRPILIYVRSENCMYCDKMQKDVWQDPATVNIIMHEFIPLKLTREENKEAVEAMKVKGYPSTLVFSPERTYISRIDGYVNSHKLLDEISGIRTASAERNMNR